MTSRVSWSVEGIEPSVRERAEAAARRAGMTLNEWLNSTVGEPMPRPQNPLEMSEIHQRLDSISRQIEQMTQPPAPRREGGGVAGQLNDAISRLDARLSQLAAAPAPARAPVEPPKAAPHHTTLPELLQFDVAEIRARQSELNAPPRAIQPPIAPPIAPGPMHPAMPYMAPPTAPQPAMPDMSGFERQLQMLTAQIEGLRRPDGVEQAIAGFRAELAEMRQAITDALPRRALDSLEGEIRSVARRIDESRQSGGDQDTLQAIEQALRDIYGTLRTLTPAEQLAGFDDAIRNLGGKIDMIVRTSADTGAMQQLESTIGALRTIVSNVASNEALERLSDDVRALATRVDRMTPDPAFAGTLAALEQRIAALTTSLEGREQPAGTGEGNAHLEDAVRTLSERIDRLQVGGDANAAFAHVEQRVMQLLERLEYADTRMANFSRVEDGLADILRHLEQQRASIAALGDYQAPPLAPAPAPVPAMDPEVVEAIRRELSDLRLSRTESDRSTQDALESVHNTLGHVVDRLAMIEGDLRETRAARSASVANDGWPTPQSVMAAAQGGRTADAAQPIFSTALSAPMPAAARVTPPSEPRPELPNPAAAMAAAAPALRDILIGAGRDEAAAPAAAAPSVRAPIDPSLPPDFPLEPGSRPQDRPAAAPVTPSERIAASEQVLSEIPAQSREAAANSTANFIAAARRAAQAAANPPKEAAAAEKPRHLSVLGARIRSATDKGKKDTRKDTKAPAVAAPAEAGAKASSKIRSLLVGVSVVVIVLSGFKMAMNMLDGGSSAPPEHTLAPVPDKASDAGTLPPAPETPRSDKPATELPAMISPTPIERQSSHLPVDAAPAAEPRDAVPAKPADVTGTIPATPPAVIIAPPDHATPAPLPAAPTTFSPVTDALPDAIGGAALRAAALRGDPAAAFEIAARYADGRGVPVNYDEAAKWFDRAADAGIVPAMFRLGTMYEKGLGGKKDIDAARRYYIRAAERGNAKAMHNLAVLDADGGTRGPNYKSAADWFRKAAEHGIADSQFNLAILYARGIGVEQNLAESYKWFCLAAAQGDADAARKRDDVAKRLDAQSLAAARLAVQTFAAEVQPDDAVNVVAPAGGWDAAPAPKGTPKRGAKTASTPRQIAAAH